MQNSTFWQEVKKGYRGLCVVILIGIMSYCLSIVVKSPLLDPLIVAMIVGICLRSIIGERSRLSGGFSIALKLFIPIGIIFYGGRNLNFVEFSSIGVNNILLLIVIIVVYYCTITITGHLLHQKKQITYLTATGSAICGASAIAITSPVVDAEADDISISLITVTIVALFGLFIFLPFLAILFNLTDTTYGFMSASVLQFTGFVKAAVSNVVFLDKAMQPQQLISYALSIKAVRYLGLLIAIPLFASMVKKKLYIPWFLWFFLSAGILGSWLYVYNTSFFMNDIRPMIGSVYRVLWSIAMAAVGFNANMKAMLSNNGTKALIMAFSGFFAAVCTFFIGLYFINAFAQ